jgi:hypothetical protein
MNIIQKISAITLSIGILMSASSCVVLLDKKHDNGKHKGHYKSWPKKKHQGTVIIVNDNQGNNGNHNGHKNKGGQKNKGGNGHKGKK